MNLKRQLKEIKPDIMSKYQVGVFICFEGL